MRIAIVHDWLTTYTGAERVLEQLIELFPSADLFTLCDFLPEKDRLFLKGKVPHISFIHRMPFAKKKYRNYLPLMPMAIEQFDLSGYDLIVSSSYAVAKGVIVGPDQIHVSYVHSPVRYAWDLQNTYLQEAGLDKGLKSVITRSILHYIRIWDTRSANGVDQFVANSHFVARRILKCYRREAAVVYPPVDISSFSLRESKDDFYVTASRLVPYKKVPLIAEAFRRMGKSLMIIGDGPERDAVARAAAGASNIRCLGFQSTKDMIDLMQRAKGFVFAAEEDFGITPVEAQACGTPVIAFGKGGALESVKEGETGIFFRQQTVQSLMDAVERFENGMPMSPAACRANAERFSEEVFRSQFMRIVDAAMAKTG